MLTYPKNTVIFYFICTVLYYISFKGFICNPKEFKIQPKPKPNVLTSVTRPYFFLAVKMQQIPDTYEYIFDIRLYYRTHTYRHSTRYFYFPLYDCYQSNINKSIFYGNCRFMNDIKLFYFR